MRTLSLRHRPPAFQALLKGDQKAREFAGQKVKVTGQVTGKTIKVGAIEAAS